MKKLLTLSLFTFSLFHSFTSTAQTLTDADLKDAYSTKAVSGRVVCHDPSIFIDNITDPSNPKYYIYGSHLGRGYTTEASNYQTWSSFKAGEEATTAANSLFANTSGNLINYSSAYNTHAIKQVKNCDGNTVTFGNFNAHGWQCKGNNVQGMEWAPDVIYNKTMKKWCMYMSLNGDNWCSSIVCFTSSSPEGPWIYQGPVVFSGFAGKWAHNNYAAANDYKNTDLEIAIGTQSSLPARYAPSENYGNFWPNCIDPCVFYDDNDNLWMSYGSWSGGIFMLKLNPENGLRDYTYKFPYEVNGTVTTPGTASRACTSDPYFGKKIAGGYYVSGEASYIQKIGKYYFLFMSYGNLESNGGYQMRVFRSENPTGPYADPSGKSAVYTSYTLNFNPPSGGTMNDYRGMLLMGGYKWDTMSGADVAQGHNSAMVDLNGRAMVVYHSRFSNGGEGHQVRVHQLFLNEDGWISAAPFEFHGETINDAKIASSASISDSDIPGDYQFMRHQYCQDTKNKAFETPVNINLAADGTISGGEKGTWKRTAGTDYITLSISNVDYKGVLVEQTVDFTNIKSLCIAATSGANGSTAAGKVAHTRQQEVWAVKADYKAAIKYTLDKTTVPISNGATISTKPTLPTEGKLGANISWRSSDTSILGDDGTVKGKGAVTFTMVISKDGYEYTKDYSLNVNGSGSGGGGSVTPTTVTYYPVSSQKDLTAPWWTNFSTQDYTIVQNQTLKFKFYNYSDKVANYDNWVLYGSPASHDGENAYFGIRCDFWEIVSWSNTGCTSNYNWDTFLEDMDGSLVDMTVTYNSAGIFNMSANITTTGGKSYNYSYSKQIAAKPSTITLFFVSEKSYIDGSSFEETGIDTPLIFRPSSDVIYNISGQRVGNDFKGIIIKNGRKYVQK